LSVPEFRGYRAFMAAERKGWFRRSRPLATVGACAIAALSMFCGPALPGTALGTYNVTGTLVSDTCGNANNPWTFTVQMSEDGTVLYWLPSGASSSSANLTSATKAAIATVVTANVDATEAGALGPCDLTVATTLDISLAAGLTPSTFTASYAETVSAATGVSSTNNCTDQLSSSGGSYMTLPCTTSYTLSGSRQ
jgi:hypothetical protein